MFKINKEIIQKLNPCADRFDNFITNYGDNEYSLPEFLALDNIIYSDKVWVVVRLFTHQQNVRWSIACAYSVLDIFESIYPTDKRPRLAIEAAEKWAESPTEENATAARSAATSAARSCARSAVYSARSARSAARSAAYSAYSAVYSAYSAAADSAYSARSAATSAARSAAYSAAYSAAADSDYATADKEDLNLLLAVEVANV